MTVLQSTAWQRCVSSLAHPVRFWGPLNLLPDGHCGLFQVINLSECEPAHVSQNSAELKKAWSYTAVTP